MIVSTSMLDATQFKYKKLTESHLRVLGIVSTSMLDVNWFKHALHCSVMILSLESSYEIPPWHLYPLSTGSPQSKSTRLTCYHQLINIYWP